MFLLNVVTLPTLSIVSTTLLWLFPLIAGQVKHFKNINSSKTMGQ